MGNVPKGSCFAISTTHVLTADHNLNPNTRQTHYAICLSVSRNAHGSYVFENKINVKVIIRNKDSDWAILEVMDPNIELNPIPISAAEIPPDSDLKIFQFPVAIFNNGDFDHLSAFSEWVKTARCSSHHVPCNKGFFGGSSGSPLVNERGHAVAMHIESIDEALEVTAYDPADSTAALSVHSDIISHNANTHSSLSSPLLLGACPTLIHHLQHLGIVVL
jgi:V8-like Glu-specific endopeptidase